MPTKFSHLAAALAVMATAIAAPAVNAANSVPMPDHVVVVMEENHAYTQIIGSSSAPYINSLAAQGALFTQSYAIEHPSQPNYLDLFSGSNQGVTSDNCPNTFSTINLGGQFLHVGLTFHGYSETLPSVGSTTCTSGKYARKHAPWINFTGGTYAVPAADSLPFAGYWPGTITPVNYAALPTLSFVIPNLNDDMHDGTISAGDTWLQKNIDGYAQWAKTHNSLLIVTWDEDDTSHGNRIATIMIGQHVIPGQFSNTINHYSVLRMIEDAYNLPYAGKASTASIINYIWK